MRREDVFRRLAGSRSPADREQAILFALENGIGLSEIEMFLDQLELQRDLKAKKSKSSEVCFDHPVIAPSKRRIHPKT